MKAVLINHNYTPDWLHDYDFDYIIYDRSDSKEYLKDFPQDRIIYTKNIGNVDYDKLGFLTQWYDHLPEIFLWGKTNLFKYISKEEFRGGDYEGFTPLLTQNHKTYSDKFGRVNYYQGGMYYERNDSWYLGEQYARGFRNWSDWAQTFFLPSPAYIPFAPGGNYILTKETVHRYAKSYYEAMRETLPYAQTPGEAQLCERSYYLLWS